MPQIVFTMDEIMDREKRDMYFVRFGEVFVEIDFDPTVWWNRKIENDLQRRHRVEAAQATQLAWFDAHNLKYELTAPRGWLEGNSGIYAVFFTDLNDPRIVEYTAAFEHPDGRSRDPENYQMIYVTYQIWLEHEHQAWMDSKDFDS